MLLLELLQRKAQERLLLHYNHTHLQLLQLFHQWAVQHHTLPEVVHKHKLADCSLADHPVAEQKEYNHIHCNLAVHSPAGCNPAAVHKQQFGHHILQLVTAAGKHHNSPADHSHSLLCLW